MPKKRPAKRMKMSKKSSKKNFTKNTSVKSANNARPMRGGTRL